MLPRLLPGLAQISKLWRGLEDEEIKPVAVPYCCSLRKQRTGTYIIILLAFSHRSSKQPLWQHPQCWVSAVSPLHRGQHLKISPAIRHKPCNCPCGNSNIFELQFLFSRINCPKNEMGQVSPLSGFFHHVHTIQRRITSSFIFIPDFSLKNKQESNSIFCSKLAPLVGES